RGASDALGPDHNPIEDLLRVALFSERKIDRAPLAPRAQREAVCPVTVGISEPLPTSVVPLNKGLAERRMELDQAVRAPHAREFTTERGAGLAQAHLWRVSSSN